MKIVIRDHSRGLYLARKNRWVTDLKKAKDFQSGVAAIAEIRRNKLSGVDLLHVFPDQKYNFAVPLDAFDKPPDRT